MTDPHNDVMAYIALSNCAGVEVWNVFGDKLTHTHTSDLHYKTTRLVSSTDL